MSKHELRVTEDSQQTHWPTIMSMSANVYDAGRTLTQHWDSNRSAHNLLKQRWFNVAHRLQRWPNINPFIAGNVFRRKWRETSDV